MPISPINFAGTTAVSSTSFQDKIRQPQAYVQTQKPIAASTINQNQKKDNHQGLKIAGGVLATIGGLTLLAKTHDSKFLQDFESTSLPAKAANAVLGGLRSVGKFTAEKAEKVGTSIKNFVGLGEEGAAKVAKDAEKQVVVEQPVAEA